MQVNIFCHGDDTIEANYEPRYPAVLTIDIGSNTVKLFDDAEGRVMAAIREALGGNAESEVSE